MKLVIDISEEDYKSACEREFSMDGSMMIYNAIREGTEYKEQPHGEWKEIKGDYGITYCGCSVCKWENEHWQKQWVACPNCGAIMKKKNEAE